MSRDAPTFAQWLLGLPWWAKLLIAAGTAGGLYLSFFMPL
jgi:hypothetical protein